MYYKAVHGTAVLFLQNAAGFAKWEPTAERIQEFLAAYQVSGRTMSSPGPSSSTPTTPSQASTGTPGAAGDKDCSKTATPELPASLDSPASQDNSCSSSPLDKTAPEAASV